MTITWHPRYTDTRNPHKAIVVRPDPHEKSAAVELRLSNRATTMHLSPRARKVPMATCEECRRMFVLNHANRRFCGNHCANRSRTRRFKEKAAHPEQA